MEQLWSSRRGLLSVECAKPVRPSSWLAPTASIQAGSRTEAADEYLAASSLLYSRVTPVPPAATRRCK